MLVDHRFEDFLADLSVPLKLNQMRTMKEPNYSKFRQLISKHMGNPVLKLIQENQQSLGLDPEIFNLVFEGFWDLYTLKSANGHSAKKLQTWTAKINLITTNRPEG